MAATDLREMKRRNSGFFLTPWKQYGSMQLVILIDIYVSTFYWLNALYRFSLIGFCSLHSPRHGKVGRREQQSAGLQRSLIHRQSANNNQNYVNAHFKYTYY